MSAKTFVDSNVLIYDHDVDLRAKHEIARTALRSRRENGSGLLSPQTLQNSYVNVTRKIKKALSRDRARLVVRTYRLWCVKVDLNDGQSIEGVDIENPFLRRPELG